MAKARASTAVDCSVCAKTISRRADLARHMKTHAVNKEEFMYACPYIGCTYKALQRSNLTTHLNVHSGERPNKCPTMGCAFSTSDPGSLTRHRKEVHGYEPKADSGSHSSAITRKEARRQRRISPYHSSSSSSPGSPASSVSSLDSSSGASRTPLPELPHVLDQFPPSSLLAGSSVNGQNTKNTNAAYSTELITKLPRVNGPPAAANTQPQNSLPLSSGLMTAPETPAVEYSQPSMPEQAQQEDLYAVDVSPSLSEMTTLDEVTEGMFDNFLSQFDDLHNKGASFSAAPSLTTPAVQYTAYNPPAPAPAPTPASLPSYEVHQYSTHDTLLPTPATLPAYENLYAVNNTPYEHYGYPTEAAFFDTRFSQPVSFGAPAMSVYPHALYPELVDQSYSYTPSAGTSGFQMQGFFLY